MAVTLGAQTATVGTDFSTTVSGGQNAVLVNNGQGVFSSDGSKLLAAGVRLVPGVTTIVFEETVYTNGLVSHPRTSFDITIAPASAAALPGLAVTPPGPSATVSVVPVGSNLPAGLTYGLLDNRSQQPVFASDLGLAFDTATGGLTGTLAPGTGLYGISIVAFRGWTEIARTRGFSVYNERVYADPVVNSIPVRALLSPVDSRVLLSPVDGRILLRAA